MLRQDIGFAAEYHNGPISNNYENVPEVDGNFVPNFTAIVSYWSS